MLSKATNEFMYVSVVGWITRPLLIKKNVNCIYIYMCIYIHIYPFQVHFYYDKLIVNFLCLFESNNKCTYIHMYKYVFFVYACSKYTV